MDLQSPKIHFVCAGVCGGVSDHPQNCEDQACNFYNQPLHKCDCTDGSHGADVPAGSALEPA